MNKISAKQQAILNFIGDFTDAHGYPPSVREIGEAVGLRSPSTVHSHLKTLSARGYLQRDERKTRALAMPDRETRDNGVPILGVVTAGEPILAIEETNGYIPYIPPNRGEHFALEVKGDSMIGAGIEDGDYVIVRKQQTANAGEIVVALLEDEATVKRLRKSRGNVWLMPENPRYEPIDGNNCLILGKVIGLFREY